MEVCPQNVFTVFSWSPLPRKGGVCGVANPRRATSPAAVCALQPLPMRGSGLYEKIVNTF